MTALTPATIIASLEQHGLSANDIAHLKKMRLLTVEDYLSLGDDALRELIKSRTSMKYGADNSFIKDMDAFFARFDLHRGQEIIPPPEFNIVESKEIPLSNFLSLDEVIEAGVATAEKNLENAANALAAAEGALENLPEGCPDNERDGAELQIAACMKKQMEEEPKAHYFRTITPENVAMLKEQLAEMGFRRLSHLANGTYSMVFDSCANQVVRISCDEPPRLREPEFLEPILSRQLGNWKIEVFPKLDYDSLNLSSEYRENMDEATRQTLATRAAAVEPLINSLKRRGIFFVDITGDNYALMKDGTPIVGDPGQAVVYSRVNPDDPNLGSLSQNDQEHAKLIREAREADLPYEYFTGDLAQLQNWKQKEVYPLIGIGTPAGVIGNAALAEMKTRFEGGEDPKISWLNEDGTTYTPRFHNRQETEQFLELVGDKGWYPEQAMENLRQMLRPARPAGGRPGKSSNSPRL